MPQTAQKKLLFDVRPQDLAPSVVHEHFAVPITKLLKAGCVHVERDRVAALWVRHLRRERHGPEWDDDPRRGALIRRVCACCAAPSPDRRCAECVGGMLSDDAIERDRRRAKRVPAARANQPGHSRIPSRKEFA